MYAQKISRIQSKLLENVNVTACLHPSDRSSCIEKGKIVCEDPSITFTHLRFDPCMCQGIIEKTEKRCDCIIFGFDPSKIKQALFVIEVKDKYGAKSLDVIKQKIQYCINRTQDILKGHMNSVEIFPILCDEKHSALKAQASLTEKYQVRCYNGPKRIILTPYKRNIVSYYLKAAEGWN